MALKDLIASNSSLTEEIVEEIVGPFIRYDVDEGEIVLLPEFNELSARKKILVYLTSLLGWRFVTDGPQATALKPGELEPKVGIAGGTLRPTLSDLRQGNLLGNNDGSYFVRPASLAAIRKEIEGRPIENPSRSAARPTLKGRPAPVKKKVEAVEGTSEGRKKTTRAGSRGSAAAFSSWIKGGYFSSPRTLAELQTRFHEEAIIIPRTSIPGMLLAAIRSGLLQRTKAEVSGRSVWVYSDKAAVG